MHDGDPLLLSALHHSFGLLLVGVIWLIASGLGHGASQANIPFEVWILAAIAAIFQYTLPFWLFLMALRFLSASIGSVLLSLEPVLVISAAAIFLGEKLAIIQWLGATLVLLTMMEMARRTQ